jgi:hypothetical protein
MPPGDDPGWPSVVTGSIQSRGSLTERAFESTVTSFERVFTQQFRLSQFRIQLDLFRFTPFPPESRLLSHPVRRFLHTLHPRTKFKNPPRASARDPHKETSDGT